MERVGEVSEFEVYTIETVAMKREPLHSDKISDTERYIPSVY